ncbi:predicted protein [Uncinocarpus reesii 1704]|uniref:Zn(2)-C6 fungal-type domain-containing protein n=1 Tax=Uncinocarpus reesii (strain UAMH 1704) TaxID=336963 RepID=C4JQW5_UNCRE|nr:uncharacterized protein UREG_03447 [Uncinocarpus reesii 1704]EEP78601.1 predicted protein [Uncinocarpus reesii 1704]
MGETKSSPNAQHQPQCQTCRKRRLRCDSTKPACRKCISKGFECPGYGTKKPLVWLQGGGNQNQYLGEQNVAPFERKARKKGRPKLLVAEDTPVVHEDKASKLQLSKIRGLKSSSDSIASDITIFYPPDVKLIVRTLWYFAIHKAVRSQSKGQIEFSREVYQYKDRTFKSLTKDLLNPQARLSDDTLVCVLALFLAEMQQSATGEWWPHFEGAKKIIDLRGGLRSVSLQNPGLKATLAYFMLQVHPLFPLTCEPPC